MSSIFLQFLENQLVEEFYKVMTYANFHASSIRRKYIPYKSLENVPLILGLLYQNILMP